MNGLELWTMLKYSWHWPVVNVDISKGIEFVVQSKKIHNISQNMLMPAIWVILEFTKFWDWIVLHSYGGFYK